MAKVPILALAWAAAATWVVVRALAPDFSAFGELHPIVIPLEPETWRLTGANHVGLVASPGRVWAVLPDRDGRLRRAVVIHEEMAAFPGQRATYARAAQVRFVIPSAAARWYNVDATEADAEITAEVGYGSDLGGRFEIRIGDRRAVVDGNPTFPATAKPGAASGLVTPALRAELAAWCVIGRDLGTVSKYHATYETGVATRVANILSALCCMSDDVGACGGPR